MIDFEHLKSYVHGDELPESARNVQPGVVYLEHINNNEYPDFEMTPEEARKLAASLISKAAEAEKNV